MQLWLALLLTDAKGNIPYPQPYAQAYGKPSVSSLLLLGYEPVDLTVHPPKTIEGGFFFA